MDGLTPAQRFFIAYATIWRMNYMEETVRLLVNIDPNAPAANRMNGPLSNFPPSAAASEVPEGSPMARPAAERATIWYQAVGSSRLGDGRP